VTSKKNPEWLILQIIRPPDTYKAQTRNVFKFAGTVLSKLKADFNADDRDRWVLFMDLQMNAHNPAHILSHL
jgi:hypothetical protein